MNERERHSQPGYPDPDRNGGVQLDREATPRWVKIFGIIALVLVLLFIVLHLTGRGLGGHMP
jgi:hypothetical protein